MITIKIKMESKNILRANEFLDKFDAKTITDNDVDKLYFGINKKTKDIFKFGIHSRFLHDSEYKKYPLNDIQRSVLYFACITECNKCGTWDYEYENSPCQGCLARKRHKKFLLKFKPVLCSETQDCSICISTMEKDTNVSKLKCGHEFHSICIETSIKYKSNCPLCRANI